MPGSPLACWYYVPGVGPIDGYRTDARFVALRTRDTGQFVEYGGIKAKGGLRLAASVFPITSDSVDHGVTVWGPCFNAIQGTATISSLERNASNEIVAVDFTFECTTTDGYFVGLARIPYL
jgi:hypothetical protein